jgi:Ser/Thr protein kinase RdoA (MazF antagonist)
VISELDFVNYLHRNGVRVCPPVPSKEGELTEVLPVEGGYFIAAVFEKAPGRTVDSDDSSVWNPDFFNRWGMLVGRLHSLVKRYEPGPLVKRRARWNPRNLMPKARAQLPESKKGMVDEIGSILDRIEIIPRDPDRFGLIHDDLNTTNFLVDGGEITLFDFDDCTYSWFISDVAASLPLYSPAYRGEGWEDRLRLFLRHFFRGYVAENVLHPSDIARIPDFLRLGNLSSVVFSYEIDPFNRQRYNDWFELVLATCEKGHPLYEFDYRSFYEEIYEEKEP